MSGDDHSIPPTSSQPPSTGWTSVDDYNSLPPRSANTGWGRPEFFQNIENITENSHTRRQPTHSPAPNSPPAYPFTENMHSSSTSFGSASSPQHTSNMARRSGFIDLTTTSHDLQSQTRSQRRTGVYDNNSSSSSPEAGPSTKRMRRNDGSSQETVGTQGQFVEQIDLSQDEPEELAIALQKQRTEAVKAQESQSSKALRMSNLTCIICLDTPKDLTATACGHWFCHTCLMEALIAGENRATDGENRRSQCPVCRKTLSRQKANDVFPALMMKALATQPKRKTNQKTKA